jgi:hypothetical protein
VETVHHRFVVHDANAAEWSSYACTLQNEGVYRITATFSGDDSYGSSWAETRVSVGPAPETPIPPEQTQLIDNTMTTVATGIAIITAIAIATIVLLRNRPYALG